MSKQLSDLNFRHVSTYIMKCILALKFSTSFQRLSDMQKLPANDQNGIASCDLINESSNFFRLVFYTTSTQVIGIYMNLNYKTRVQEVKHINHIKTLVSYFQFFIWTYGAFFPPHDYKCTMQAGLYKIRLGLRPQKCYASLKKQSLPSSVKSRHYKLIQGTQFAYMQDV